MFIEVYRSYILQRLIKDAIDNGTTINSSELDGLLEDYEEEHDLSVAQFEADSWAVEDAEISSADKYNGTFQQIFDDLTVLYRHLFDLSNSILDHHDRWAAEGSRLQNELSQLTYRAQTLIRAEESGLTCTHLSDDFSDCSKIDFDDTTARVDTQRRLVTINPLDIEAISKQFTDTLSKKSITFSVLTKSFISSVVAAPNTKPSYILDGLDTYWQNRVYTTKPIIVSAELKIDFETSIYISRILVDLHASNNGSSIQVLPLYSTNGRKWIECSTDQPSQIISDKGVFLFPRVECRYIKFLLVKEFWDLRVGNLYAYEFGVDNLSFFDEELLTEETTQIFTSKALSSLDPLLNQARNFSSIELEACELIPEDTDIDYFVAASNDENHALASCQWIEIAPNTRTNATRPQEIFLGDLVATTLSGVGISYDPFNPLPQLINPSSSFYLVNSATTGVIASAQRYAFQNKEDRILSYSLSSSLDLVESSLEVWRNVNTKGSILRVRGEINGWKLDGVYYSTYIYVSNTSGVEIDFGPAPIHLDEVALSGRIKVGYGKHSLRVHKDNWTYVDATGITTLAALKSADRLYPYNQRYLVEGFNYPSSWSEYTEKVYKGFDIVAESLMQRVGVFDILHNCSGDYTKYALDWDAADPSRSGVDKAATRVFLLKVDPSKADFLNEKFLIKFDISSARYKYLRLRAILRTTDSGVTPSFSGYKIKLGGL